MVNITPKAAEKLKILIVEENNGTDIPQTAGLRLYVQGGGCSGFQYGLKIVREPAENDKICESNGIRIFIDPISVNYLRGSMIDYSDNLVGGGFFFQNPNAKGTCGCGSSFEPK